MDFQLTEEQQILQQSVRDFVARYCPREEVRRWDDTGQFPPEIYERMAEQGYLGIAVDPEYGGSSGDIISQTIILEELVRGIQASAVYFLNTSCFGAMSVGVYGTEEQKRFFLPALCEGKMRFAISITEPGGGTDVLGHMKTFARKADDGWVVNGVKMFTTAAAWADYILLVTRSKRPEELTKKSDGVTVFLFPTKTEGVSMRPIPTMGHRTIHTYEVVYDNVRIADRYVLGEPHQGWKLLLHTLNNERILTAAYGLGSAQAALDDAVAHAKVREAFGKPIGAFQAIAHHIANMAMALEQARLLTYKAAWLQSVGKPCGLEATMAKCAATEAASMCSDLGMQILGGTGMSMEADMQRYWRDSRVMRIGPVSNEMARNFVAMELGLPRSY